MHTREESLKIFKLIKERYKQHCIHQFICNTCKYNCRTGDRVDCFEKFYAHSYADVKDELSTEKSKTISV